MNMATGFSGRCRMFTFTTLMLLASVESSSIAAHPESDEVKQLLQKGVRFIEQNAGKESNEFYKQLGGTCVTALAILKNGADESHPLIADAIGKCQRYQSSSQGWSENNYSMGLAIIFLCELDPVRFRAEIERLMADMLGRQIPGGAWTYSGDPIGDTSQTQYASLAMWIAFRSDIPVPTAAVERCCNWLIRTQAPNGGFTYKGQDPGSFTRQEQDANRMTPTMGAAGTGSLYICSEILGFIQPPDASIEGLPSAVKEVRAKGQGVQTDKVDPVLLRKAVSDGNRWLASNMPTSVQMQQYYYMYSLERFQAFRELSESKFEKEPSWYNNGVQFLATNQAADGSWKSGEQGPVIDTAFAILFLLRSARKTIAKIVLEQGVLVGGKGLPKDLTNITLNSNGKVVKSEFSGAIEDVLKILEDPKNPRDEFNSDIPEEIQIEMDPAKRTSQMARLRRLAISGSFQGRLTAVKSLSRVRDLENVPALIFALSDGDTRVIYEARMGLRFISRKFDDFGPFSDERSEQEVRDAQRKWGEWFKSIRPDGELLE